MAIRQWNGVEYEQLLSLTDLYYNQRYVIIIILFTYIQSNATVHSDLYWFIPFIHSTALVCNNFMQEPITAQS